MAKNKHLHYFSCDIRGELNFVICKVYKSLYSTISSLIAKGYLQILGVTYGKDLVVRGRLQVSRHQCSKIEIGNHCRFNSSSLFNYRGLNHHCILQTGIDDALIKIGHHCGFSGVSIVANTKVLIGNNVIVGANTIIGDRDGHNEIYASNSRPILIEDHVWIGMNVIILKGVHIGANSIIAAGAVVTKNIPANEIWGGNPAKFLKNK